MKTHKLNVPLSDSRRGCRGKGGMTNKWHGCGMHQFRIESYETVVVLQDDVKVGYLPAGVAREVARAIEPKPNQKGSITVQPRTKSGQ